MAKKLWVSGVVLGVLAVGMVLGCASGSVRGHEETAGKTAPWDVTFKDNCDPSEMQKIVNAGDRIRFRREPGHQAKYRIVIEQKAGAQGGGAYFPSATHGRCTGPNATKFTVNASQDYADTACGIQEGSSGDTYRWGYTVKLLNPDGSEHCHKDPDFCIVRCM